VCVSRTHNPVTRAASTKDLHGDEQVGATRWL
jgi:hypothetical protein